jgi:hypothetical protein
MVETAETVYCATHPNVETELRCGRCEKPICAKCLVHTPVGARCPDCAQVRGLPTYSVGTPTIVRGAGAAIVAGTACGVVWWLFNLFAYSLGLFFVLLGGFAIGYVVGEAVAVATNRRRGTPLEIAAGAGCVLAYLIRAGLLVIVDGWTFDTFRLVDALALVSVLFAAFIAVQRVR